MSRGRKSACPAGHDIYSFVFVSPDRAINRSRPLENWRRALEGTRVLISFQTRAEILAGALGDKWGAARVDELRQQLDATPTISADSEVIDAYATLRAACVREGHALQAKQHNADRWNAACAIAKGLPLFSADRIYVGALGLELFEPSAA